MTSWKWIKKLQTFDWSYFIGKSHYEEDGTQNYLVFQPMYKYFERVSGIGSGNYIDFWKSKESSDENVTAPNSSSYKINPQLSYFGTKTRVGLSAGWSKQDKITYDHGKGVNIYIVYEMSKNLNISDYPTLKNAYLVQLVWPKMLILVIINILYMMLDLVDMDFFHILVVELPEM